MRASGQGLFMMMVNGFGAFFGSRISGWMIDTYFMVEGKFDWRGIWLSLAAYSLVVAILFFFLFKHEHKPEEFQSIKH
jgi:NHS family xanthosine MFS transporter